MAFCTEDIPANEFFFPRCCEHMSEGERDRARERATNQAEGNEIRLYAFF